MAGVKTDRIIQAAIAVCLAGLAWVVAATYREKVVVPGDSAPGFTVTTDDGRTLSPTSFGGKLLVVHFWATWCPPCVTEMPSLDAFQRQYASAGVVVLGISVDRNEASYRTFLRKYQPAFLTARERNLHEEFGTFMYPETYIIAADGKVLRKIAEGADWMDPNTIRYFDSLIGNL